MFLAFLTDGARVSTDSSNGLIIAPPGQRDRSAASLDT